MAKAKEKSKYFLYKGRLFLEKNHDDLYIVGIPVKVEERENLFTWTGHLIPMELHRQIISFFQAGYEKTKSENLVWLYHNFDTGEWMGWAPPQECIGMTVEASTNDLDYNEQRKLIPKGFIQLGSYHHHCGSSAFASSTDNSDEIDREGLHITIGGIGVKDKQISICARACFDGTKHETEIEEWIDYPVWIENIPTCIRDHLYQFLLYVPETEEEFPKMWLDNCKKKEAFTSRPGFTSQGYFPHWREDEPRSQPTQNSRIIGPPSTDMGATHTEKSTGLEKPNETIAKLLEEKLELDPPLKEPNFYDKRALAVILEILLTNVLDAGDMEGYMERDLEEKLTPEEDALLQIFYEECHSKGLHPKRVYYLFENFDLVDYFDYVTCSEGIQVTVNEK